MAVKSRWLGPLLSIGILVLLVTPADGQEATPTPTAGPEPIAIVLYNPTICVALGGTSLVLSCVGTGTPSQLRNIANFFGDNDDRIEPSDFDALQLTRNQLHQVDKGIPFGLRAVVFVDDDDAVEIKTSRGLLGGLPLLQPDAREYRCDIQQEDEDCDGDGIAGDGVVSVALFGAGAELGPGLLSVTQGRSERALEFTVVGEPDSVEFLSLETAAQVGIPASKCELATEAAKVLAANATPERSVILGIVRDEEGTAISGAWLGWSTDDEEKAVLAQPATPTLDLGSFGVGAPNMLCATNKPGKVTVRARILRALEPPNPTLTVDPNAELDEGTKEFNIVGPPAAVTLTVNPDTLTCDGRTSAEVAASVVDSAGTPVVNGTEVRFDVRVLGTASPIKATTTDGVAKSKVTPLALADTGVPVIVTAGNAQASVLVKCGAGAPAAAPPPPAPPGPVGAPPGGAPAGVTRPPAAQPGLPRSGESGLAVATHPQWMWVVAIAALALTFSASAIVARRRAR